MMSPTNAHRNADRVSFGRCSASASPYQPHHLYYASSPTEDSRGSSDTRFSTPLKYRPSSTAWRKLEDEDDDHGDPVPSRCYVAWLFLGFVLLLFALFFLVLWGVSKFYKPHVFVKGVVFQSYDLHAGTDFSGVPTKMLTINSTVIIAFRNSGTFFGLHAWSTTLEMNYSELKIASGYMREFYLSRKSGRVVAVAVVGTQVPLYGVGAILRSRAEDGGAPAVVPLELSFKVRARAKLLGPLVKSTFYCRVRCSLSLREDRLGEPLSLARACQYHDSNT